MAVVNITIAPGNTTTGTSALPAEDESETLEAYTVVVSVTCHVVALAAGGSSNLALLLAMCARRRRGQGRGGGLSLRSYAPVFVLLLACVVLCTVWSPLEAIDMLTFHQTGRHAGKGSEVLAARTSLHIFLLILLATLFVLMGVAASLRMFGSAGRWEATSCSSSSLSSPTGRCIPGGWWPPVSAVLALLTATLLTSAYLATYDSSSSLTSSRGASALPAPSYSYVDLHSSPRAVILALTLLALGVTLLVAVLLLVFLLRDCMYWEDGRLRLRRSKPAKLVVPDFLISQSNAAAAAAAGEENTAGSFDPSTASASATPSPSTPKLLAVVGAEPGGNHVSNMPGKSLGSRLGVNMAQVLGRRRHTICQIGDSAGDGLRPGGGGGSTGTGSNDPIGKAKQYGYVRKFSVDVSALQAQLQNPKLIKEAPFQSSVDLANKTGPGKGAPGKQTGAANAKPEPLMPLKPLPKSVEEKLSGGIKSGVTTGGLGADNSSLGTAPTFQPKGTPPPAHKNGAASKIPDLTIGANQESRSAAGEDKPAVHVPPQPPSAQEKPVVQTPPQPPPPVIMVSVDDDRFDNPDDVAEVDKMDGEHGHVDETTPLNPNSESGIKPENNDTGGTTIIVPTLKTEENNSITSAPIGSPVAKKPTSLAFKDSFIQQQQQQQQNSQRRGSCYDDDENRTPHGLALDSELSYATSHDGDDHGDVDEEARSSRLSRLVLLLHVCYLLALLPVAITELLYAQAAISWITYSNSRACFLAAWSLQALFYPHLLIWGDRNLRRAARKLRYHLSNALERNCSCCRLEALEPRPRHAEESSSTSQV